MTLEQCAIDADRSYQTLLRWCAMSKFPFTRRGIRETRREIYVDPADWERFCTDNNIVRKGDVR